MTSKQAGSTSTSIGTAVVTLPSDTQILVTREFNAPKHLVYQVFTKPELIKRWWAGGHGEVTLAEVDLQVGGAWRYVMTLTADSRSASTVNTGRSCPTRDLCAPRSSKGYPKGSAKLL